MATSDDELQGALKILDDYHNRLSREAAEEIIQRREDFEDQFGGADNLIEKHYLRLHHVSCVYNWLRSNLKNANLKHAARADEILGKNEFRCFSCGGVIRRDDQECRHCGWSWKAK